MRAASARAGVCAGWRLRGRRLQAGAHETRLEVESAECELWWLVVVVYNFTVHSAAFAKVQIEERARPTPVQVEQQLTSHYLIGVECWMDRESLIPEERGVGGVEQQ